MSHSTVAPALVQYDTTDHAPKFVPSDDDRAAYAAWLADRDEPGHTLDEPTPLDEPWWAALPFDPELDEVRYEPTEPEAFDRLPDHSWDDFDEAVVPLSDGQAIEVRVYLDDAPGRIPAGAMLVNRPFYLGATALPLILPVPQAVEPIGIAEWDDFDEAIVRLADGRRIEVRIYLDDAPGRIPMGATLLNEPLFVAVSELD